jgi:hypothetical protein
MRPPGLAWLDCAWLAGPGRLRLLQAARVSAHPVAKPKSSLHRPRSLPIASVQHANKAPSPWGPSAWHAIWAPTLQSKMPDAYRALQAPLTWTSSHRHLAWRGKFGGTPPPPGHSSACVAGFPKACIERAGRALGDNHLACTPLQPRGDISRSERPNYLQGRKSVPARNRATRGSDSVYGSNLCGLSFGHLLGRRRSLSGSGDVLTRLRPTGSRNFIH